MSFTEDGKHVTLNKIEWTRAKDMLNLVLAYCQQEGMFDVTLLDAMTLLGMIDEE